MVSYKDKKFKINNLEIANKAFAIQKCSQNFQVISHLFFRVIYFSLLMLKPQRYI